MHTPTTSEIKVPKTRDERIALLKRQYDAWCEQREDYAERDSTSDHPSANEWEWSDDSGIELMHYMADLLFG